MANGNICYFEPNQMDYNVEDLCIGISLEVIYIDRALSGGNTLSGSVNILSGSNDMLSTSYSDVTVLELEGGGNKESIGIENINIKYNTWYFPEVNIKFVDVRGNAVFNPMEKKNEEQSYATAKGSFLKSFFMFPYPIFKLTVKGYFGKPVTYRLTVKGVPKATFNSNTGNFEIAVDFIGHMYFGLTDIPMSLVMSAPSIKYGGGVIELGTFPTEGNYNGVKIPTFINFINDVFKVLGAQKKDNVLSALKNELSNIENKIKVIAAARIKLEEINKCITDFYTISANDNDGVIIKLSKKTDKERKNKDLWGLMQNLKDVLQQGKFDMTNLKILSNDVSVIPEEDTFNIYYNYINDDDVLRAQNNALEQQKNSKTEDIKTRESEINSSKLPYVPTLKNIITMTLAHLNVLRGQTAKCMDNIDKTSKNRNAKNFKGLITDCNVNNEIILICGVVVILEIML